MKTFRVIQTCGACPSQWEGTSKEGEHIYIRFRWGCFSYGIADTEWGAVESTEPVSVQESDYLSDGVMTTEQMRYVMALQGIRIE